ncbi:MAG: putative toxin-antitoxin system toxin component, PIN family [bacterium]
MYKWMLDTNIIISGLFWSGKESKLLKQAISQKYEAVICEFVLQETKRIIEEKFSKMKNKAHPTLELLINSVTKYPLLSEKEVIDFKQKQGEIITDKSDLVILATAHKANVDAIITGDNHFLNPKITKLINIIDTKQALQIIKKNN